MQEKDQFADWQQVAPFQRLILQVTTTPLLFHPNFGGVPVVLVGPDVQIADVGVSPSINHDNHPAATCKSPVVCAKIMKID